MNNPYEKYDKAHGISDSLRPSELALLGAVSIVVAGVIYSAAVAIRWFIAS